MKILIVTNHFYPETFRVNDVAFHLASKGHAVIVITSVPNYPGGKFFTGYGLFRKRRETVSGVDIVRVPVIPRGNGNGIRLFLNYASYLVSACFAVLFLSFKKRFDCVFVHETSPVTVGIPAVVVKRIQKIPLYFWVLDLWPESLSAAGGIKNRYVIGFFEKVVRFIYDRSDKILISSKGFADSIRHKGEYESKLIYFPNWGEDVPAAAASADIPELPEGFKIMFAGNIGEAQDFESILQAAWLMKEQKGIKWILIGDGRKKEWVDRFIAGHRLEETVYTLGRYPIETMPAFFRKADAMLVTLKDEFIFNLTVPAKLQAYLAASKPVLAMLNGEGAGIIEESGCGYVVRSGDYSSLVQVIRNRVLTDEESFRQKGKKGKEYFDKFFRKEKCMSHLEEIIKTNRYDGN